MEWQSLIEMLQTQPQWKSLPFKTKEARKIFDKVCNYVSSYFYLQQTAQYLPLLHSSSQQFWWSSKEFTCNLDQKNVDAPQLWRPRYSWIVATENESLYRQLKDNQIPAQFIDSTHAIDAIDHYDVIRVLECEQFSWALERMPQCLRIESISQAAPEFILREFAKKRNSLLFAAERLHIPIAQCQQVISSLLKAAALLDQTVTTTLNPQQLDAAVRELNKQLIVELESVQINGSALLLMMQKKQLPLQVTALMEKMILQSGLPGDLILRQIPLEIDEELLEQKRKEQSTNINRTLAVNLLANAQLIDAIPALLSKLDTYLVAADLVQGIAAYIRDNQAEQWIAAPELTIRDSRNLFLANPQPISFRLDDRETASILTGANSGGKTTLLEHMLQLVSLRYLNLPVSGNIGIPEYTGVYYFAKNKGSTSKGAFETLLTQLATIETDGKILLLADEMEAVTEPAVASRIMAATLSFFIERNCHIIFATHLGGILLEHKPERARVDGIEASGLDEDNNLVVNHNPVLGKLAKSTPELIVQRLAKQKNEYLIHLASVLS